MSKKTDAEQIYKDLSARVDAEKGEIAPIYKELAAKVGAGESEHIQRIIAKLANLEQARMVAALPASGAFRRGPGGRPPHANRPIPCP